MAEYGIITSTGYKGTHGTSHSRAQSISSAGFLNPTHAGRAGVGVYFWSYDRDSSLAKELATHWWKKYHGDGEYDGDACKECAVILVDIAVDKKDTINLECLELREMLSKLILQHKVENFGQKAKVYELLLRRIEEKRSAPYELVGVSLDPPGSTQHHWLSKSQPAYIVRSSAIEKISIKGIKNSCKSTCRG